MIEVRETDYESARAIVALVDKSLGGRFDPVELVAGLIAGARKSPGPAVENGMLSALESATESLIKIAAYLDGATGDADFQVAVRYVRLVRAVRRAAFDIENAAVLVETATRRIRLTSRA